MTDHFANARQIAELIASGKAPLLKAHLIDAWVKSMLAGLKKGKA